MTGDRASFGKHQVLARLGRGGMGNVYLAVNFGPAGVHKLVVIKQLRSELEQTPSVREMFFDEARIGTRLNHPNIVQTHAVIEEGDELYLLMDFLDGQSLAKILGSKHRAHFSRAKQLRILADALAGLHYAHELTDYDGTPLHVVHRDVSPQNIIVTYDGYVKLVDFGVATAADTTSPAQTGTFKGKVRYSAPEQASCREVDRRVDIFAMGVILWEILAERRMWQDLSDMAILASLAAGATPGVDQLGANVPAKLKSICARALAPDPNARFATAREFRAALLEFLAAAREDTELGPAITASFAQERRDLHAAIDGQIKAVREASVRSLSVRNLPTIGADASAPDLSALERRSSLPVPVESDVRSPRSRRAAALLWTVSALAVAAACFAILRSARHEPSAAAATAGTISAPAAAPSAPAAPSASSAARVHLHMRATPSAARLFLDGAPLPSNPYDAEVVRDGTTHVLLAKAEGFAPRAVATAFATPVDLDLALDRVASPAAARRGAPRAEPRPDPESASALTPPPPRVHRSIDEDNPYAP